MEIFNIGKCLFIALKFEINNAYHFITSELAVFIIYTFIALLLNKWEKFTSSKIFILKKFSFLT